MRAGINPAPTRVPGAVIAVISDRIAKAARHSVNLGFLGDRNTEYRKIGFKRIFTLEQIKELIRITENLIRKGVFTAGSSE